jgi:hypothetical protein
MADDWDVTAGPAFTEPGSADLAVISQLQAMGADLSKPRHVIAYLYFTKEQDGERAAADLASEGFFGSLGRNEAGDSWLAKVELEAVVSDETIRDLSELLRAIARRHNGEYDGWEASAEP